VEDIAKDAISKILDWDKISNLVNAFGGGWEAVATIGILATCAVVIVIALFTFLYKMVKLQQNTKVRLAELGVNQRKRLPWILRWLLLWRLRRRQ
jgi:hypothetical protein